MPIITLTSDWGLKDYYLAVAKGKILSKLPEADVVDISHEISPFNLKEASFIIRNSYVHFPRCTVHLISLLTDLSENSPHVMIEHEGHYFIGSDNGVFSLIFEQMPQKIVRLHDEIGGVGKEAPARDRFIQAAALLLSGSPMDSLGTQVASVKEQLHFAPVVSGDVIRGVVIYVNHYENVITNIRKDLFDQVGKGRRFAIEFRGEAITRLRTSYMEVPIGEIAALFGSTGHLEIAINQGNASSLLGLEVNDPVRIEFKN